MKHNRQGTREKFKWVPEKMKQLEIEKYLFQKGRKDGQGEKK
jgi:hypothetical protein